VKNGGEQMEDQWAAENEAGASGIGEAGHDFGVEDAEDESRDGNEKTNDRSGCADVEESAGGADGRANEDERAHGADQSWKRNEEGITGVDMVLAASEVVAKFMGEENGEESESERKAGSELERVGVDQSESTNEGVPGDGLIFGVGVGELGAGDQAGAEGEKKEQACEEQGFARGVRRDGGAITRRRGGEPVDAIGRGGKSCVWERVGHENRAGRGMKKLVQHKAVDCAKCAMDWRD
jgi:hypothetical protein